MSLGINDRLAGSNTRLFRLFCTVSPPCIHLFSSLTLLFALPSWLANCHLLLVPSSDNTPYQSQKPHPPFHSYSTIPRCNPASYTATYPGILIPVKPVLLQSNRYLNPCAILHLFLSYPRLLILSRHAHNESPPSGLNYLAIPLGQVPQHD